MSKSVRALIQALQTVIMFLENLHMMRLLHGIFAPDPERVAPKRVSGWVIADPHPEITDYDKDTKRKPYLIRQLTWLANLRIFNTVAINFSLNELEAPEGEQSTAVKLLAPFPFAFMADSLQSAYKRYGEEIFKNRYVPALLRIPGLIRGIIDDADSDGTAAAMEGNAKRKTVCSPAERKRIVEICHEAGLQVILSFSAINIDRKRNFMLETKDLGVEYSFQGYIDDKTSTGYITTWLNALRFGLDKQGGAGIVPQYSHLQFYKPSRTANTLNASKFREVFWLYWNLGVQSWLVYGSDELTDPVNVDLAKANSPISDSLITLIGCVSWACGVWQDMVQDELAA